MHVALATAAQVNPTPEYTHCTESEFEGYTFSGPDGRPALKTLVALAVRLALGEHVEPVALEVQRVAPQVSALARTAGGGSNLKN